MLLNRSIEEIVKLIAKLPAEDLNHTTQNLYAILEETKTKYTNGEQIAPEKIYESLTATELIATISKGRLSLDNAQTNTKRIELIAQHCPYFSEDINLSKSAISDEEENN